MVGEILIGSAIGKVIYDINTSEQLDEKAMKKSVRSLSRMAEAQVRQQNIEETMEQQVMRLMTRKKAILITSMDQFLHLYEKVIAIHFTESDGIKELDDFSPALREQVFVSISAAKTAKQPHAISRNVIVGYLKGGLLGALSSSIVDDSKYNLQMANLQAKQADAATLQARTITLSCQAVIERVTRMTDVLTKLNGLFVVGINRSEELIEKNGMDKKRYSVNDRKTLATCIDLAKAVKDILNAPVIDQNGAVTQQCLETIQAGEQWLNTIDYTLNL